MSLQEDPNQPASRSQRFLESSELLDIDDDTTYERFRRQKEFQDARAVTFLRNAFKSKSCARYVPRDEKRKVCQCGAVESEHQGEALEKFHSARSTLEADGSLKLPDETDGSGSRLAAAAADEREAGRRREMRERPTNAFGRIEFHPPDRLYRKASKYVRLSDSSPMESVMDLIRSYWRICEPEEPGIVISVIGSSTRPTLQDRRQRAAFNRGLIRSIQTTRGWLLTLGTNSGVSEVVRWLRSALACLHKLYPFVLVGEAVREGQSLEWRSDGRLIRTIHCIGVPPWGAIRDTDALVNDDPLSLHLARYYVKKPLRRSAHTWGSESLDPFHSHFLLVDDGLRNRRVEKGVPQFRAALEQKIAASKSNGGLGIPVVCLLVGGGLNSASQAAESCRNGTPVLVCHGTGKAADLIAEVIQLAADEEAKGGSKDAASFREQLGRLALAHFRSLFGPLYAKLCDDLVSIADRQRYVSVFTFEKPEDFDMAILSCLLDARKLDVKEQLSLAFAWDRPEFAAVKILNQPEFTERLSREKGGMVELVEDLLERALVEDRVEFVRVLIDHGASIQHFLTVRRLRKLYNCAGRQCAYTWPLLVERGAPAHGEEISLSLVHALIKSFTRRFNDPVYRDDTLVLSSRKSDAGFDAPFHELFLWAVVMKREGLAVFLWELSAKPIRTGIVGTVLCHGIASSLNSTLHAERIKETLALKDTLEALVVGVVNEAYANNPEKAALLVNRPSETWGDLTPLGLAALAEDKELLGTNCAQYSIFRTWKRGFQASGLAVALSTFTVLPVVLGWIKFQEDLASYRSSANYRTHRRRPTPVPGAVGQRYLALSPSAARMSGAAKRSSHRLKDMRPMSSEEEPQKVDLPFTSFMAQRRQSLLVREERSRSTESEDFGVRCVRSFGVLDKLIAFYSAPVVKFTNHTMWYILYLLLYCYVVLFGLREDPEPVWPELLLYAWQGTFILEEIRYIQTYPGESWVEKAADWWSFGSFATWNRVDVVVYAVSIAAFVLRFAPNTYPAARLLLVLALIGYILRIFKVYFVNAYLGPKVVMIKRMSWDLAMFVLVLFVFFASYSIATQGLIRAGKGFELGALWDIFQGGIWDILGEPNEDSMSKIDECKDMFKSSANSSALGMLTQWNWDCILRSRTIPLLLALYLLFGNVLMINMLIAIFSHVFEEIQGKSELVWRYEMYFVVEEFREKPLLPPPFIVLAHAYRLLNAAYHSCRRCARRPKAKRAGVRINGRLVRPDELEFLNVFEQVSRADWLENRRLRESVKLEATVASLQESVCRLSESLAALAAKSSVGEEAGRLTAELSVASNASHQHRLIGEEED